MDRYTELDRKNIPENHFTKLASLSYQYGYENNYPLKGIVVAKVCVLLPLNKIEDKIRVKILMATSPLCRISFVSILIT